MNLVVSISDARVSSDPGDTLTTYSLGSCIGVAVYDPHVRVGGLLHFQLPNAVENPDRAAERPLMFADTGMRWLLEEITRVGARKPRLRVRIAGAAQMLNDSAFFNIGKRNHTAIRKILWQQGLFIESEHIGGDSARTMILNIADGNLVIRHRGESVAA